MKYFLLIFDVRFLSQFLYSLNFQDIGVSSGSFSSDVGPSGASKTYKFTLL
jgi:hypothetical protein